MVKIKRESVRSIFPIKMKQNFHEFPQCGDFMVTPSRDLFGSALPSDGRWSEPIGTAGAWGVDGVMVINGDEFMIIIGGN